MIPQLVIEERPHASTTLLDPLWCVKCTEGADRTEPKDQEELNRLPLAGGQTAGIGAVVADPLEIKKEGLRGSQWILFRTPSQRRQERGDDFELEVVLVAVAVGPALEDANLIVEPLHQAEADLVLRVTVRRDALPVAVDHRRERLVGREPLPLEALSPALEEGAGPALGLVAPELAEGLLEQVGGVQSLVGLEQLGEGAAAVEGEVLAVGEQGVALPLDEGAVLGGEAAVLMTADLVERVAEVTHDVELVKDDARLWRVTHKRGAKGLPHVHRGKLDARRLFRAQCGEEEGHVGLGAALAADPDRPPAVEVADDDAVVVPLPDGNLVHTDRPWRGPAGAGHLLLHVDRVEVLDRAVVEALRLGHRRVGHLAAERAHVHGEALGEARVLRQPVEALYVHAAAPRAVDPKPLELDVDAEPAGREVAGTAGAFVVPAATALATLRAAGRFFRRRNTRTLAYRSPKKPTSREAATKPGSEKRERIDVGGCMR